MTEQLDEPMFRSWEEYWPIVVRRRWWILLPLFLVWAAVWGISWLLPMKYESESVILVEEQKVPDQYVLPNVKTELQERLQSLTQQILSRSRLRSAIERFHLYSGQRHFWNAGDPVDEMRSDIKIEPVVEPGHPGDYSAFTMRYTADSPELAQRVNRELTSLFVNENFKRQRQLSENTTAFLEKQVENARAKMAEQESRVAAFKTKHLGALPSQLESNVQILAGLQSQFQSAQQALDDARQQKIYLESLLQQYQSAGPVPFGGESAQTPMETLNKQLIDMYLKLAELQSKYKEGYPDIVALKDQIANVRRQEEDAKRAAITNESNQQSASAGDIEEMTEVRNGTPTPLMQVQSQLKANQLEISNVQQHVKALESEISAYKARLNSTPVMEQDLTAISRGYEESKANYNILLQKQMQSQLATNLEVQQQGEQFLIIDPPTLPNKPSAPNHLWFSVGGLLAGILVGLGLTILLEQTNPRIEQEADVEAVVPVRVLVSIPHLKTPGEARFRVVRLWTEFGAATALVILILIGNLYALYKG
jgi:succinoglycan biosynthesis transport protein ExoP